MDAKGKKDKKSKKPPKDKEPQKKQFEGFPDFGIVRKVITGMESRGEGFKDIQSPIDRKIEQKAGDEPNDKKKEDK